MIRIAFPTSLLDAFASLVQGFLLVLFRASLYVFPSSRRKIICASAAPLIQSSSSSCSSHVVVSGDVSFSDIISPKINRVHLIVLAHGFLGSPKAFSYFQQALEEEIEDRQRNQQNLQDDTKFIVYVALSNFGNTADGVAAGGSRLAAEINHVIDRLRAQMIAASLQSDTTAQQYAGVDSKATSPLPHSVSFPPIITLSIVGHSLGGLYARFALSEIVYPSDRNVVIDNSNNDDDENCDKYNEKNQTQTRQRRQQKQQPQQQTEKQKQRKQKLIPVEPKVFMTTATPHLGIYGHTHLFFPRWVEVLLGSICQKTAQDVFGLNDLIERMTVEEKFVKPLKCFSKRIAYANAYATDFEVPTNTAAFLSDTTSTHYRAKNNDGDGDSSKNSSSCTSIEDGILTRSPSTLSSSSSSSSMICLTVETRPQEMCVNANTRINTKDTNNSSEMACRLDAMGWTKVFCDVRSCLISVPVLCPFRTRSSFATAVSSDNNDTIAVQQEETYTSSALCSMFGNHRLYDNRYCVATGHAVIIANSKNDFFATVTQGGRPLVREIARDLIRDILVSP